MLRILTVVDKEKTAIDRLAQTMKPYMLNCHFDIVAVHPKRPDPNQIAEFEQKAQLADIIDYQYFRTADMLRATHDWLKSKPSILAHHNPYSITERDWNDYQIVIANNQSIYEDLKKITTSRIELIPNAVDPYFWKFNEDWKPNPVVLMVANRIEAKKGILHVALACQKLDIKMQLVGSISDMDYFNKVMQTEVVEYAQDISDEQLRDMYYNAGLHVCNSQDGFESGTMPILESIFCGTPVLTREIGIVPEIKEAVVLGAYQPNEVDKIAAKIEEVLLDKAALSAKRDKLALSNLRNDAWFAIKDRIPERRAYMYTKLYRELLEGKPVTVILPISDRPELTLKNLEAIESQTHKNIEVIVVDDGQEAQDISHFSRLSHLAIRYIRLGGEGYHLAKARNLGIIEATSDVLIFCDQRIIMDKDAVEIFLSNIKPKTWLFGDKGANKKEFVENFSCINREDIITLGMFNERVTEYGGMSQEVRARAKRQFVNLEFLPSAKSQAAGKSGNRFRKKYEILKMKTMLWKAGLL